MTPRFISPSNRPPLAGILYKMQVGMDQHLPGIEFRPAGKADCRAIANLYSISSDGVADYIWTTLAQPGENLLDVGQRRYERENTAFSYQNCTLAVEGSTVAGMLVAFPMVIEAPTPPETDPVLAPYSRLEVDNSYYICGVAVFPDYRNRGIGSQLMALAETHALQKGFNQLSLIVFEQNVGAKRLYERLGYREVAREAIVPHRLIRYTGDAVLMVKELTR
jgi:ribosomal protein S18 acetylase RimI-like enzyme